MGILAARGPAMKWKITENLGIRDGYFGRLWPGDEMENNRKFRHKGWVFWPPVARPKKNVSQAFPVHGMSATASIATFKM